MGVKYKADRMLALEDQDISSSEEEDNYSASSSEEEVFELYWSSRFEKKMASRDIHLSILLSFLHTHGKPGASLQIHL